MGGAQGLNADQVGISFVTGSPDKSLEAITPRPIASLDSRIQGLIKSSGERVSDKRREQTNLASFRVTVTAYCKDSPPPTQAPGDMPAIKDNNVGVSLRWPIHRRVGRIQVDDIYKIDYLRRINSVTIGCWLSYESVLQLV